MPGYGETLTLTPPQTLPLTPTLISLYRLQTLMQHLMWIPVSSAGIPISRSPSRQRRAGKCTAATGEGFTGVAGRSRAWTWTSTWCWCRPIASRGRNRRAPIGRWGGLSPTRRISAARGRRKTVLPCWCPAMGRLRRTVWAGRPGLGKRRIQTLNHSSGLLCSPTLQRILMQRLTTTSNSGFLHCKAKAHVGIENYDGFC